MIVYDVDLISKRVSNSINNICVKSESNSIATINFVMQLENILSTVKIDGSELSCIIKYDFIGDGVKMCIKSHMRDIVKYESKFSIKFKNNDFLEILKSNTIPIIDSILKSNFASYFLKNLNVDLQNMCQDCDILLQFDFGRNVVHDIADTYIVIGLSVEQALSISDLKLYKSLDRDIYMNRVKTQIGICQTPCQILKYKLELLQDLGVNTRSRLELILRKRYTRNYSYIGKNGVGYLLTEDFFALIESVDGDERLKLSPIDLEKYTFSDIDLGL